MIVECIAIVLIVLLISFTFLRAKRANYAMVTLPLIIVPVSYIVGFLAAYFFIKDLGTKMVVMMFADLLGLIIACIILGAFSFKIPSKRARLSYLFISGGFLVILSILLLIDIAQI